MIAGTLQKTDTAGLENFHRRYPKHSKILIRIWRPGLGSTAEDSIQGAKYLSKRRQSQTCQQKDISHKKSCLANDGIPWWQPEDIISEVRAGPESGVPQQAAAIATTW